jgi:hypothetical protein
MTGYFVLNRLLTTASPNCFRILGGILIVCLLVPQQLAIASNQGARPASESKVVTPLDEAAVLGLEPISADVKVRGSSCGGCGEEGLYICQDHGCGSRSVPSGTPAQCGTGGSSNVCIPQVSLVRCVCSQVPGQQHRCFCKSYTTRPLVKADIKVY